MLRVSWRPACHAGLGLRAPEEAGAGGGESDAQDAGQIQARPAGKLRRTAYEARALVLSWEKPNPVCPLTQGHM